MEYSNFRPYNGSKDDFSRVNTENLGSLIAVLKNLLTDPDRFDMGSFGNVTDGVSCGTTACIAGWEAIRLGYKIYSEDPEYGTEVLWEDPKGTRGFCSIDNLAANSLGLTSGLANWLFYGNFDLEVWEGMDMDPDEVSKNLEDITLPEAIFALEWLLSQA